MPIYEYSCRECGQQSEISHRMADPPATICPVCGKPGLTKQMSATAFRLKGGGWYETDFKSDGKKNLAGDTSEAAPVAKLPDSKPADAKPAVETKAPAKAEPASAPVSSGPAPSSTT